MKLTEDDARRIIESEILFSRKKKSLQNHLQILNISSSFVYVVSLGKCAIQNVCVWNSIWIIRSWSSNFDESKNWPPNLPQPRSPSEDSCSISSESTSLSLSIVMVKSVIPGRWPFRTTIRWNHSWIKWKTSTWRIRNIYRTAFARIWPTSTTAASATTSSGWFTRWTAEWSGAPTRMSTSAHRPKRIWYRWANWSWLPERSSTNRTIERYFTLFKLFSNSRWWVNDESSMMTYYRWAIRNWLWSVTGLLWSITYS